jgi:hypothetical protein
VSRNAANTAVVTASANTTANGRLGKLPARIATHV